jgi:hypothetical protein
MRHQIQTVMACEDCELRRAVWLVVVKVEVKEGVTRKLLCDAC